MPPFTVLHLCVGNICRSPMAERLLTLALRRRVGDDVDKLYLSHGAGTGSWHVGEPMNPPAERQLVARGADPSGFRARRVSTAMVDTSHLVLCATSEQVTDALRLRPDAVGRTFVLGEFGRLLLGLDHRALPPVGRSAHEAFDRGMALVASVDAARGGWDQHGRRQSSHTNDDLADPWGMADREFSRVADEIERTVFPLASVLTGFERQSGRSSPYDVPHVHRP